MVDIVDPTVTAYSNEKMRPWADRFQGQFAATLAHVNFWDDTIIPILNTLGSQGADEIVDGARQDGRAIVNYTDSLAMIQVVKDFKLFMEGGAVPTLDRRAIVEKFKVNTIMP